MTHIIPLLLDGSFILPLPPVGAFIARNVPNKLLKQILLTSPRMACNLTRRQTYSWVRVYVSGTYGVQAEVSLFKTNEQTIAITEMSWSNLCLTYVFRI